MPRLRGLLVVAGVLLLVAAVSTAVRLKWVHDQDWDYSLTRSATPTKLHLDGRDFKRGRRTDDNGVCADLVPRGTTGGGATILAPADHSTSTVICVVDGDATWLYGLMGGP